MARQAIAQKINHYNNGYVSYPNRRICYPDNIPDENEWLAGWYRAKEERELEFADIGFTTPTGISNDWWFYKTGE